MSVAWQQLEKPLGFCIDFPSVPLSQNLGQKETLGDIGNVYYFDYGDGIMGVCLCLNSLNCIH